MTEKIQAAISKPGGWIEIEHIDADWENLARIVGARYVSAFMSRDWQTAAYVDEDHDSPERGLRRNETSSNLVHFLHSNLTRLQPTPDVYGTAIWVGVDGSTEIDISAKTLKYLISAAFVGCVTDSTPITVIQHDRDIWVFDGGTTSDVVSVVQGCARKQQTKESGKAVQIQVGLSKARWTEIRVDIMDDFTINLHDRRADRSYG